ncbi:MULTISPECIES: anti-sigma factor [unclassified Nocardiopsis]|uniref:anti-sigma factor family protein n=1 Tax=unclassified Nocardiopsis TaxID=2649073 RepID=UPI00135B2A13|nr:MULTISPECIES: zf-HC2 domain-containing protein [unclassified Nocardiopsis]
MSSEHLGERLSALVDGELGPAEHESALIHLARCESCRFEADLMRRLKRRLHGLCEPEPDADFMGRLAGLSRDPATAGRGPTEPPPGGAGFGAGPPLGLSRPLGGFPGGHHPASAPPESGAAPHRPQRAARPERHRPERLAHLLPAFPGGRYAVAGFAVASVLIGSAFVAGGDTEETPVVQPRLSDYAVEHAVTSRHLPVAHPQPKATELPYGTTEANR